MSDLVIPCYCSTEFKEEEKNKAQLSTANHSPSNYTVVTAHARSHVDRPSRKLRLVHGNGSVTVLLTRTKCCIAYSDDDNCNKKYKNVKVVCFQKDNTEA